jgi:ABC-type nitrate/sulfonate/bicarbonate transport system substrate-binding protein
MMKRVCLQWFRYRISAISAVAWFIIFLTAGSASALEEQPAEAPVLLRIGYLPVLSQLPLIVSFDRERLSYQKVQVQLTGFKSFIALEAAFRVKAIDIAYLPIPTILAMKAEGINVLMGDSLHSGGSSLVMNSRVKEKDGSGTVYGIPGLTSSELLILYKSLGRTGLNYGDDYKVIVVQLDSTVDELVRGNIDGVFLPEPYPTIAAWQLPDKVQLSQLAAANGGTPQSALAFNRNIVLGSNRDGLLEWLDSIDRACLFLEKDIRNFGAAQTILTQQHYFGFEPALIRQAFDNMRLPLKFSAKKVHSPDLAGVIETMISLKLLQKSVEVNDMLLDPYLLQ